MEEEFFIPQNVRTSYQLTVLGITMGPKHLRRAAIGLPLITFIVVGSLFPWLGPAGLAFWSAMICGIYLALYCWPIYPDGIALLDVLLHTWGEQRRQTRYPYREEVVVSDADLRAIREAMERQDAGDRSDH